ncbi:IS630 transposase-related protein [Candidatus Fukatsuia endosymbiont of Tuberolachnus salignus]|uniref:IS630 transposase-related protein n=1 Tax=Candidatus Fukatsuia endosymbiont of Tuberolachnus salignus TaxID=3077957 RepID=UPI00313B28B7
MSYSVDFRRKVLSIREQEGLSIRETAKRFHIGTDPLTRWLRRIEPQQSGSRRRKIDKKVLVKDVERYPDAYQRERAAR